MTYTVNLRSLEPEDLDLVYRMENDTELWTSSATCQPLSRYMVRQYLEHQQGDIYNDGELRLVIMANGQPVGFADLTSFCPHHLRAEVGIMLLPEYRHQGIATVALQQLASYVSTHLHLTCLYAFVADTNIAAKSLFHKLGYSAVATLPQWIEGRQSAILFQLLIK